MIDAFVWAATTPVPTPTSTVDPDLVTPGPVGFAVVVIIVIAVFLLVWDMLRRIRTVRYREEVRAELDAEEAETAAQDAKADPTHAADDENGEANTR